MGVMLFSTERIIPNGMLLRLWRFVAIGEMSNVEIRPQSSCGITSDNADPYLVSVKKPEHNWCHLQM